LRAKISVFPSLLQLALCILRFAFHILHFPVTTYPPPNHYHPRRGLPKKEGSGCGKWIFSPKTQNYPFLLPSPWEPFRVLREGDGVKGG